jgi:guanosine-3',5'-bis(diphosphate) 3'-pyrophosphohydrolase
MKKLAEKYHAGQFRKGGEKLPYIVHPQAVAETLQKWGEDEKSIAIPIAWGHDLLEDTAVSESEILAVSSTEVLQGIKLLTRPRSMDKALYLQSIVESGNRDTLLVKISDRICNTNAIHSYNSNPWCILSICQTLSRRRTNHHQSIYTILARWYSNKRNYFRRH